MISQIVADYVRDGVYVYMAYIGKMLVGKYTDYHSASLAIEKILNSK
jgi:hypothetical protein